MGGLGALQYQVNEIGDASEIVDTVAPIGHPDARFGDEVERAQRRDASDQRELPDSRALGAEKRLPHDEQRVERVADDCRKGTVDVFRAFDLKRCERDAETSSRGLDMRTQETKQGQACWNRALQVRFRENGGLRSGVRSWPGAVVQDVPVRSAGHLLHAAPGISYGHEHNTSASTGRVNGAGPSPRRTTTMTLRSLGASVICLLLQAFFVPPTTAATTNANITGERRIWMAVGERRLAVTLADNEAARAFASQLPLTLDMADLNGNEKHAKLPKSIPTSATRPGTIRTGDPMLWGADTLVVFYLTFDSPYSYTRLGRIDDAAALTRVLGQGTVRVTFAKE
ncbi:MAG TPA: cyclophilin-like fold protein [Vicinamibacterales bacterium]|nr:cyclophilin-like fold protein [Vicinamibacterales bacterium]